MCQKLEHDVMENYVSLLKIVVANLVIIFSTVTIAAAAAGLVENY